MIKMPGTYLRLNIVEDSRGMLHIVAETGGCRGMMRFVEAEATNLLSNAKAGDHACYGRGVVKGCGCYGLSWFTGPPVITKANAAPCWHMLASQQVHMLRNAEVV